MSNTRLLLDGPDLQALVRRAEEAGGRVVRAERLRKELLGKTWYEVTVEVPRADPPGGRSTRPATRAAEPSRSVPDGAGHGPTPPRPAGIHDLLAAAEAAERADQLAGHAARSRKRATKEDGGR